MRLVQRRYEHRLPHMSDIALDVCERTNRKHAQGCSEVATGEEDFKEIAYRPWQYSTYQPPDPSGRQSQLLHQGGSCFVEVDVDVALWPMLMSPTKSGTNPARCSWKYQHNFRAQKISQNAASLARLRLEFDISGAVIIGWQNLP